MTKDELIEAGFKPFQPSHCFDKWATGFQLKVKDEVGIRYFVQVYYWGEIHGRECWEADVVYNDGAAVNPASAALKILAYAGVAEWSATDVVKWADGLWERLSPNYYERWQ